MKILKNFYFNKNLPTYNFGYFGPKFISAITAIFRLKAETNRIFFTSRP